MGVCITCGNDYDKSFEVAFAGKTYVFDCFECAIHTLAPSCQHCGCRIIGHGLEAGGVMFCCDHCAEATGESRLRDRVDGDSKAVRARGSKAAGHHGRT